MKLDQANQYYAKTWAAVRHLGNWSWFQHSRGWCDAVRQNGISMFALKWSSLLSRMSAWMLIFNDLPRTNVYSTYTLLRTSSFTLPLLWMQIFLFFILSVQDGCFRSRLIWSWSPDTAGNCGLPKKRKRESAWAQLVLLWFLFCSERSRELAWQMSVLISRLNHLRVIFISIQGMHIIKGRKHLHSIR